MEDLSLHILDVVENGTAAGATLVEIHLREDSRKDWLELRIQDNGCGMDETMLAGVRDPFVTTRTTRRVGMGIPLLDQATREAEGSFEIRSRKGCGTEVIAGFRLSHIDRRPLGDLAETMVTLILGHPEVDFVFTGAWDDREVELDTRELKQELEDVPLSHPSVLNWIRREIREAVTGHAPEPEAEAEAEADTGTGTDERSGGHHDAETED